MIRRPRSPCLHSWLHKIRFHSVQMLPGPAHPARPGSAHARAVCQRLHFFAEGLSLPAGPVLSTSALSASPLGHNHAEASLHTRSTDFSPGPEPGSPPPW